MNSPLPIIGDQYLIISDWAGTLSALDITNGGTVAWGSRIGTAA